MSKPLAHPDTVLSSQESLRLMPPVPMTFRKAGKTDYIDGVLVPEGTLFYIPVCRLSLSGDAPCSQILTDPCRKHLERGLGRRRRGVSRHPRFFLHGEPTDTNQCRFNPSRWLNLPPNYNPIFSSLSFLAGPHGCIGKTMAIVEMKAILS